MKFTKEQLSEALKAGITNNGKKNLAMSERSFNEEVEDIYADLGESGNNEELELADAVGKKIKRLERIDNNVRNDNSKFVKEWEKNHPQKNDGDGNGDGNDDGGNKSELQKMQEQINSLLKREEENNKAKAVSEKRSQLKSALKGKDVKNEDWINDQLELIHIDSETDVDALTERLVKSYNKFNAPGGTGGGKEKTDVFADVVAVVKKQSHREEK